MQLHPFFSKFSNQNTPQTSLNHETTVPLSDSIQRVVPRKTCYVATKKGTPRFLLNSISWWFFLWILSHHYGGCVWGCAMLARFSASTEMYLSNEKRGPGCLGYMGFLKWWYPTTMGFPTKHDHFGMFWGYHHLRKHAYMI